MSRQRRKGTDYENHILETYLEQVFPHVDRAPLKGTNDAGDFINTRHLIIEAKKRNAWRLPEWIRQTAAKGQKFSRPWSLWFANDKRKGDPLLRDDFVVVPASVFTQMLMCLYGPAAEGDPFDGLYGRYDR